MPCKCACNHCWSWSVSWLRYAAKAQARGMPHWHRLPLHPIPEGGARPAGNARRIRVAIGFGQGLSRRVRCAASTAEPLRAASLSTCKVSTLAAASRCISATSSSTTCRCAHRPSPARGSLITFGPLARQVNPTLLWDPGPSAVSATAFTAWIAATGDECPLAASGVSAKAAADAGARAKWAKGGMTVTAASKGWAAVEAERMGEAERLVRRRSHDPSMVATVKQLQGITSYRTDSAAMVCAPRRWTSLLSEQGESPG